ncbi:MAG: hypothetical protein A2Z69_01825 [Bacteroidetes bacterium RBG_13_44_24]|nr:MAG: hypothetical protein A2Z69_01825 [Bacteroidetes bacterium RBG_13_44_24]
METKKTLLENLRPPIVTILGHVDHGKTTLLDFIRETNVAKKEVGGITQRIGASVVETKEGKKITFIDTPGHAAFAKMRSRGASVADIAVLVVAGEEGIKPQTQEALNFILDAKIPYIVAVTKIDLPTASIDNVRSQFEKTGISFEGRGGDVPLVGVSSRTGKGVEILLDLIALTSEVYGLKGNSEEPLEAVVIETGKDKRGSTTSVVVKSGKLTIGQDVVSENVKARIRGIFNFKGESVREVFPGEPALILGFKEPPIVGSRIWTASEKENLAVLVKDKIVTPMTEGKMSIILKTQSAGSVEAIISNIPSEVLVVSSGVGDVTEGDIFLAKSTSSSIFAFEAKVPLSVSKLAENEGVKIESFNIVYELFERLEEIVEEGIVEIKGKAEIIAIFSYDGKSVAGCKVTLGKILKMDKLTLFREMEEVGKVKIISMKKGKQDIQEAKQGEECGILFAPQLDFRVSDMLISVRK